MTDTGDEAGSSRGGSDYGPSCVSKRVRGIGGTVGTGEQPGGGFRVCVAVPSGGWSATA